MKTIEAKIVLLRLCTRPKANGIDYDLNKFCWCEFSNNTEASALATSRLMKRMIESVDSLMLIRRRLIGHRL